MARLAIEIKDIDIILFALVGKTITSAKLNKAGTKVLIEVESFEFSCYNDLYGDSNVDTRVLCKK